MLRPLWPGGALCLLTFALACASPPPPAAPPPQAGPVPTAQDPQAVFEAFLRHQVQALKYRHQVETRFLGRTEVIDGFLLLARPDRFWVRALSPLGATLFDVRQHATGELTYDMHIPEVDDRAPGYLARDIRRLYLDQCPSGTPARAVGEHIEVSCELSPQSPTPQGSDPPDDHLVMELSPGGLLTGKRFSRSGEPTAVVTYGDYGQQEGRWWAHSITLEHRQVDYALRIRMLQVDPNFHVERALGPSP